jgi:F0F1-type ATP synthase assembly protein I
MKLLPTQTRVATDDALAMAIEIAVILLLFVAGGFFLDRWLGTLPLFMIVGTVLGSVGLFTKHKYRYDQKMDAFEAERRAAVAARTARTDRTGGTNG